MASLHSLECLSIGTEVSAKYRGAFCEAKIIAYQEEIKYRVKLKDTQAIISVNASDIIGSAVKAEDDIQFRHSGQTKQGKIIRRSEILLYKVAGVHVGDALFNDGDERTLRRNMLCLKGEKHFQESETLDNLPLSNPEHFCTPVLKKRGVRPGTDESDADRDNSEDEAQRRDRYKERYKQLVGKVMVTGVSDKRKGVLTPVLVVLPSIHSSDLNTADRVLVRSFRDMKFSAVCLKELKPFSRQMALKNEDRALKPAFERALMFFDSRELPASWNRETLLGKDDTDDEDDEMISDEDRQCEENDHFVAQLYKFMDDRGTPINKGPCVGNKDLNLYRLFNVVQSLGGYNKVTNQVMWRHVYSKMGLPSSSFASHSIKLAYKKYLHAFEDFYRRLGSGMGGSVSRPGRQPRSIASRGIIPFRCRIREPFCSVKTTVEAASATIVATGHSTAFAGGVAHSSDNGGLAGTPDGHGVRDATAGCSVDGTVVPLSGVPVLCPAPAVNVHPDDGCGGVREHVDQKVNQGVVRDCGCETGSFDEVGLVTDGPEAGLPHSRSKKHQEVGKPPSGVVSKPGIQRLNKSSQLRNMVSDAIKLPVKARNDEESNPQEVGVVSVKLELGTENGQPRLAEKLKRQHPCEDPHCADGVSRAAGKVDGVSCKERCRSPVASRGARQPLMSHVLGSEKTEGQPSNDGGVKSGARSITNDLPLGAQLRVRYGRGRNQKIYEAKIVERNQGNPRRTYLVHYAGWNTRYDEWVRSDRIIEVVRNPDVRRPKKRPLGEKASNVSVKKRSFGRPIPASSRPRLTRSNNSHHEANDMTDVQSGLDALITSVEMTVAETDASAKCLWELNAEAVDDRLPNEYFPSACDNSVSVPKAELQDHGQFQTMSDSDASLSFPTAAASANACAEQSVLTSAAADQSLLTSPTADQSVLTLPTADQSVLTLAAAVRPLMGLGIVSGIVKSVKAEVALVDRDSAKGAYSESTLRSVVTGKGGKSTFMHRPELHFPQTPASFLPVENGKEGEIVDIAIMVSTRMRIDDVSLSTVSGRNETRVLKQHGKRKRELKVFGGNRTGRSTNEVSVYTPTLCDIGDDAESCPTTRKSTPNTRKSTPNTSSIAPSCCVKTCELTNLRVTVDVAEVGKEIEDDVLCHELCDSFPEDRMEIGGLSLTMMDKSSALGVRRRKLRTRDSVSECGASVNSFHTGGSTDEGMQAVETLPEGLPAGECVRMRESCMSHLGNVLADDVGERDNTSVIPASTCNRASNVKIVGDVERGLRVSQPTVNQASRSPIPQHSWSECVGAQDDWMSSFQRHSEPILSKLSSCISSQHCSGDGARSVAGLSEADDLPPYLERLSGCQAAVAGRWASPPQMVTVCAAASPVGFCAPRLPGQCSALDDGGIVDVSMSRVYSKEYAMLENTPPTTPGDGSFGGNSDCRFRVGVDSDSSEIDDRHSRQGSQSPASGNLSSASIGWSPGSTHIMDTSLDDMAVQGDHSSVIRHDMNGGSIYSSGFHSSQRMDFIHSNIWRPEEGGGEGVAKARQPINHGVMKSPRHVADDSACQPSVHRSISDQNAVTSAGDVVKLTLPRHQKYHFADDLAFHLQGDDRIQFLCERLSAIHKEYQMLKDLQLTGASDCL